MTIHTIQRGDTIDSIAAQYNVPVSRLERDNDLSPNSVLSIGQALMITYPLSTYVVKSGDTLEAIAAANGVTVIQLLRNNPQLSDVSTLAPGTELVISYDNKAKKIYVNGFANSYINIGVLKKTLPFLTYITILNYMVNADGSLTDIPDEEIIATSKAYNVAPIMFISAFNVYGVEDAGTIHSILNNPDIQNSLITNTLSMLRKKGYYGLYLGFQKIAEADLSRYIDFVSNITGQMNKEGYEVYVSLIPSTFGFTPAAAQNENYISSMGQAANYVTLMTYQWMSSTIPDFADTGAQFLDEYAGYVTKLIPPEKIYLGLDRIAYDWQYPYTADKASGNFISDFGALNLANQYNAEIQLDTPSQAPFYYYTDFAGLQHFVWYKDARTVDAIIDVIFKYGLKGVAIWNVMYYFSPTFTVINTQYDIVNV